MPGRKVAARMLHLLSAERGAPLWVPSLLLGSWLVLYGIRQAPAELSLFNQARDLRIIVGPLLSASVDSIRAQSFVAALRRGLQTQQEVSVVAPEIVEARLEKVLGTAAPHPPRSWIRATRNLNARYYLVMSLQSVGESLAADVEVWEVSREEPVHSISARSTLPGALGLALAESLSTDLFDPEFFGLESRMP